MSVNIKKILFLLQELNLDFYHIKTKTYEISSHKNESLLYHNFNINFNIYYSTFPYSQTLSKHDLYTTVLNNNDKKLITKNELNIPLKENKNNLSEKRKQENLVNKKPDKYYEYIDITSPLPGIFYSSPMPGAEPFVKIGSIVEHNTIVCIIETMKVMNQIKANQRGKIEKILFKDGDEISIGDIIMQVSSL
uniref:Biotin carboxyl carrier protein of acetyl-CoA carboxylase n=1 Tax=Galdieria sulphuraria TaxID=130081 RepID=A0A075W7V3_GALSU|nr:acetyl-CoA carboxylase biotin carboxyl carrier protein [Galdieria sulphuraria]AIG92524.1 acetyl-CoA carboxylase biotin carboxyl carrier protein [Galdieria sulphuraria]